MYFEIWKHGKKIVNKKIMLSGFKICNPVQFGIFLTFATIKVVGEPKQQNLISTKKLVKRTGCLQPSNSLPVVQHFVRSSQNNVRKYCKMDMNKFIVTDVPVWYGRRLQRTRPASARLWC